MYIWFVYEVNGEPTQCNFRWRAVRRVLKCKQACSILKQDSTHHFFEPAQYKFDLTLKVYATQHYIEDRRKKGKNDSPNVKKSSPNVTKSPPNVIGLAGSKKGKTETANALT
jgi:hypothetical protein